MEIRNLIGLELEHNNKKIKVIEAKVVKNTVVLTTKEIKGDE